MPHSSKRAKHDHYYLLCPRVLVAPSRWTEVNPFDERLSYDEQFNAGARLIVLGTASTAMLTQDVLKSSLGGVLALALLHLGYVHNKPEEKPAVEYVESHNPLPMATHTVAPQDDLRTAAVDKAFGTGQRRGDVQLYRQSDKIMPDRRALHGMEGDEPAYAGLDDDEPGNRNRLFSRQVARDNFSVAVAPAPSRA